VSVDVGSSPRITIPITNSGGEQWSGTGPGSFRLIWEMRNSSNTLVATSSAPTVLPGLAPGRSSNVGVVLTIPKTPGDYKVTLGLVDSTGRPLAALGAATATFQVRAHQPYLVASEVVVPTVLHSGEASLMSAEYTALPTAGTTNHVLVLAWRVLDAKTNRSAGTGTVPVGTLEPGASGTFFFPFVAPTVLGSYKLSYELRERNVAVNETRTSSVTIIGPRTFPDDEGGRTPPNIAPRSAPTPSPTPRLRFPAPSGGVVPIPQLPTLPRGATPTPKR
jgi:hypothetical protein